LTVICLSPLIFSIILFKYRDRLYLQSVKDKIGSLYLDLKVTNYWGLLYSKVFIVRRVVFLVLTFVYSEHPNIQIQFFAFTSVLYVVYLM
jgi:hypothetical protein